MSWIQTSASRFLALFRRTRLDHELDEELYFHLHMETEENIRNGMSPGEAQRQARLRLGGVEQVKEAYRDRRAIPFVESLLQDVRFALRSFRKDLGFTATVVVAMVLGVGIGTTMFAVVNGVLIQPLPYEEPDRLVAMWRIEEGADKQQNPSRLGRMISWPDFVDWRDHSGLFESALNIDPSRAAFPELGRFLHGAYVDGDLCETFGVRPALGRCLAADDFEPDAPGVILLLHDTWKRRFGADPNIIGRTLPLGSPPPAVPTVVVGVMPPGFYLLSRDVGWIMPWNLPQLTAEMADRARSTFYFWGIGRLKEGLSLEQAQAAAEAFSQGLAQRYPASHTGRRLVLKPLAEEAAGGLRDPLLVLFSATGIVLLIVCSNIAGLALVRALTRSTEFAVRSAIGAGRGRLIRQLITENVVLSFLGGLLGLVLAAGIVGFLSGWLPKQNVWSSFFLQADRIVIDLRVAAFSLAVAVVSGVLFGLLPAFRGTSLKLAAWVKEGANSSVGSREARHARQWLSIAQVSLAVVLATSACVSVRTFLSLHQQGPGFRPEQIIGLTVFAGTEGRKGRVESKHWWREVRESLGRIPGVTGVASSYWPPIGPPNRSVRWIERSGDKAELVTVVGNAVGQDYFRVLGIPLIEGRHFDLRDQAGATRVAIVSAEAARRFWPGESALDKTLRNSEDPNVVYARRSTVIGVVGDVRAGGLQQQPEPIVYVTQAQGGFGAVYWMVRSARSPDSLFPEIVSSLRAIDPAVTILEPGYHVLDDVVWDSTWQLNYTMILLAGLAGLSLLISAIGVYGVLSYTVRQRTREIGLRLAIGADRAQVLRMILRQGLSIAAVGIVVGLVLSAGLTRFLGSLLYGVEPVDALTFALVAAVMLAAAFLASYLPAAKAAGLDPTAALRDN